MKRPKRKHNDNTTRQKETPRGAPAGPSQGAIRKWWPAAVALGLVAAYYWPILFCKGFLWNDFTEQNFPYRVFAAVSLRLGEFPLWTPYVFSGMPFFADVQAAVLYPLNLALTLFASHEWLSPIILEYQVIFHIFLAGFFMYLLAREMKCDRPGALIAAITFMFCGFFTTHIFHVNLIHTATWFPLIILLLHRAVGRLSLLYAALTAIVLFVAFLSGYPQLMLHMYYWMAAYFLFVVYLNVKRGTTLKSEAFRALVFTAIVGLSLGMSSIQLLPTQELARNSVRPKLEFTESCEGSLRPYRLITLLAPNYFGRPDKNDYWGNSEKDFNPGGHYYWETAIYTGIAPLILAVAAMVFVRTPLMLFLGVMAMLSLLLAMGDSFFLYSLFYNLFPGFKSFRVPGRFAFLFTVSVSLLAGFGLQWLKNYSRQKEAEKNARTFTLCLLGATVLCVGGALFASAGGLREGIVNFLLEARHFGGSADGISRFVNTYCYPGVVSSLWLSALFLAAATTVVVLRLRGALSGTSAAALLCVFAAVDFFAFGHGFAASSVDPRKVYRKTPAVAQVQEAQQHEFFRINSRDSRPGTDDLGGSHMAFYKNQGNVHRIFLMEGYNPLRLKRQLVNRKEKTLDILNIKYSLQVDEQKGSMGFVERQSYFPRCRMVHDYTIEGDEDKILPTLYSDSFDHKRTVVLEEDPGFKPAPRDSGKDSSDDGGVCRIVSYSINSISMDVAAGRDGLLVLSEIFYPEWKATVDNAAAPLLRADYALRAIPVKKGNHRVTCFYDARALRKGLLISLASLALTIALGAMGFFREKKKIDVTPAV
jgi:hypothetical protein